MDAREYQRQWRETNKEKVAEYQRKWREKNPEKIKENLERFNETHPNYKKEYYSKNKDRIYERQTRYRHENAKKISKLVLESKKRKVEKLRSDGVVNAWGVVNYQQEPRYKRLKRGAKKKGV